jgi:hypothetical protein
MHMYEEFFKNLEMMDREQLLTQYSDIYKEKYETRPHLGSNKLSDEDIRNAIKELVLDESRVINQLKALVREELKRYL